MWDLEVYNKLQAIKPCLGITSFSNNLSRREVRVLHRLWIGHRHYTHTYLLRDEDQPECVACQCPLTVQHILISCVDFNHIRSKYFNVSALSDLFNSVESKLVLDFIKEIGLYNKF
jgi:hypothetical protein